MVSSCLHFQLILYGYQTFNLDGAILVETQRLRFSKLKLPWKWIEIILDLIGWALSDRSRWRPLYQRPSLFRGRGGIISGQWNLQFRFQEQDCEIRGNGSTPAVQQINGFRDCPHSNPSIGRRTDFFCDSRPQCIVPIEQWVHSLLCLQITIFMAGFQMGLHCGNPSIS